MGKSRVYTLMISIIVLVYQINGFVPFTYAQEAIGLEPTNSVQEDKITVVTTLSIIADWTSQIGKNVFTPTSIVSGNEDPHTYSLSAGEIQLIGDSDLFIRFGLPGIEPWVDDILATFPDLNVLTLASTDMMRVDLVTGNTNPHIWMDPNIVKIFISNITDALISIDPTNQETYKTNEANYLQQLDTLLSELNNEYRPQFENLKVVVHHPAFMYLFDLLGIQRMGVIEEHEGSEPSAQHIQEIVHIMKENNVSIIVTQPQISDETVIQIARDTGAKLAKLTPLLGVENVSTYIDMIEYDIYALQHPESIEQGSGTTIALIVGIGAVVIVAAIIVYFRYIRERMS